MFDSNEFKVICEKDVIDEVKQLLENELSKQGYDDVVMIRDGIIYVKDLLYVHLAMLKDNKVVYIDGKPIETIGPSDVFKKVKEIYPDVELGGVLEIGDDNSRNKYIFNSPKGSQDVLEDYAYLTDDDEWIPASKAWFYYVANTDYGPEIIAFVKKGDFKEFLEALNECADENEMDLEEFFGTDEFMDFLSDNDYSFPEYEDERNEFWKAVMEKYKSKK